jgi:glycosyltransferase involved in cell wall biosynthesis
VAKRRLISNVQLTNRFPDHLEIDEIPPRSDAGARARFYVLKLAQVYRKADCVLVLNPDTIHAAAAMLSKLFPAGAPKVIFFDVLLKRPGSASERFRASIKRFLFQFIDVFLLVHRDTTPYEQIFGIKKHKCRYVPFKPNNFDLVGSIATSDQGYVFAGGSSYRDYACFTQAMRGIDFPARIVLPSAQLAAFHNTLDPGEILPPHVELVRHDGGKMSWNSHLAGATLVVIPIRSDCIQPAGISVYLEAMALGKPVIIAEGASTKGLLDQQTAVLYEPGNAADLATQISHLLNDPGRREELARKGRAYALSLGGEDRLSHDLQSEVLASLGIIPPERL